MVPRGVPNGNRRMIRRCQSGHRRRQAQASTSITADVACYTPARVPLRTGEQILNHESE